MKIAIVGAGALGSLFGAVMSKGGHEVWLYNPSNVEHIDKIRSDGLQILAGDGSFLVHPKATSKIEEIDDKIDLVGIFVKAYDTQIALEAAAPIMSDNTWVLSLQNGIGPENIIAQSNQNFVGLRGVTSQGATFVESGVVRWGGRGATEIGPLGELASGGLGQLKHLIDEISEAGWSTSYSTEIELLLWQKLLINAAINPLTALFEVKNGLLVEDVEMRTLLHLIVEESLPAARSHGVSYSLTEAIEHVEAVCENTAKNTSSMLQDVQRKKRTEVEFINGAIVRESQNLDTATPLNLLVTRLLMKVSG